MTLCHLTLLRCNCQKVKVKNNIPRLAFSYRQWSSRCCYRPTSITPPHRLEFDSSQTGAPQIKVLLVVPKCFSYHHRRFVSTQNVDTSRLGLKNPTIDGNTTMTTSDGGNETPLLDQLESVQKQGQITVSILGPSNAGKSTLFNRLMCKEANRAYRLASEKSQRRPNRSKGRLGNNNPSRQHGGAIVSATPGTTRDRRECIGRIGGTYFTLIDTAGVDGERISLLSKKGKSTLSSASTKSDIDCTTNTLAARSTPQNYNRKDKDPMETKMIQQTLEAARQSDLIILMFDARVGLTADFADIVQWLRKIRRNDDNDNNGDNDVVWNNREVVIVANKLEGDAWANYYDHDSLVLDHLAEVASLGFGEPLAVSAEHGEGIADIAVRIEELTRKKREFFGLGPVDETNEQDFTEKSEKNIEKPLRLAILGRQNVGKSTLVNSLLKQDRVIAGSTPGLTRDAIAVNWSWMGRPVQLVDTAGIRRMAKRDNSDEIEDLAVRDAMRAMKIADVAVLVLDAEARMLQRQELAIADAVVREGRSLVVAANKMDLLVDAEYTKEEYAWAVKEQIQIRFPMLRSTPVVSMSSLTGEAVEELMPVVFNARDRWARVIGTGLLNRWLAEVVEGQQPPMVQGRAVKIKYIMQVKGRPPTFILFCNVDKLPASYLRFLTRNFQETFQMFGMEVRLAVRKSAPDNPFNNKKPTKGSGIGGAEFRRKRLVKSLKTTGKPPKKGKKRRNQKSRYS